MIRVIRDIYQKECGRDPGDVDSCGQDTFQYTVCNRKKNVRVCIPHQLIDDCKISMPGVNEAARTIARKLCHLHELD
jgi:hypothetical protein